MAEFIPFDDNVEVRGETVLAVCKGVESILKPKIEQILKQNNITAPKAGKWYKQKDWLNSFKDIANNLGPIILYKIGKAIPSNAIFPQGVKNLKEALMAIDKAYKTNHRGGEIGYYKLVEWNEEEKKAVMECKNPYPCHFDRGIITKIANDFKPKKSSFIEVFLDIKSPNRLKGADSSRYFIKWQ